MATPAKNSKTKKRDTATTTGEARLNFLQVTEPDYQWFGVGDDRRKSEYKSYSARIIIPKSDEATHGALEHIVRQALLAAHDEGKISLPLDPANFSDPIKDGDTEPYSKHEENLSSWVLTATSGDRYAPGLYLLTESNTIAKDSERDPDIWYDGIYGSARISARAWVDKKGKVGVSLYLNSLLKLRDGDRLGGSSDPDKDFAAFTGNDAPNGGLVGRQSDDEEDGIFGAAPKPGATGAAAELRAEDLIAGDDDVELDF